jgi:tetratricopeptide (TPR) repeat protein
MLGFAWLTFRQAQEALKNGRLEEAQRLLSLPGAQGHRKLEGLLGQLARAFVERGERHLRRDDAEAAWRDLLQAEQLQTAEKSTGRLREALTRLGVAEVRALLQAGEPRRADEALTRLRERATRSPEVQVLDEAAKGWLTAKELADQGEFARSLEALGRVSRLLPGPNRVLEQFRSDVERRQERFAGLLARLHEAVEAARWQEVIEAAEQVLATAPQHAEARKARSRAWKVVEPVTVALPRGERGEPERPDDGPPGRFLLWIDGVGGYLICLGSRIGLGQASADGHVEIPFVADVSRIHATLMRDAEGYVLEGSRSIQVNGQTTTRAMLRPNDRVTLGPSCQFQFRQPVPVSATARLDLVSGHRLPLSVDAVLLMADTLILGSGPQVHVTVPDLKQPFVLFRCKDGLGYRHSGSVTINGQKGGERGVLSSHTTVTGDEFAFAIEPVGTRMGQC